jgi:hypothetical protein
MTTKIKKVFDRYKNKTESDYYIMVNGQKVSPAISIHGLDDVHLVTHKDNRSTYKEEFIKRLSPDHIDSRKFWKIATTMFPLFSVCGGGDHKTIEDINVSTLGLSRDSGTLKPIYDSFVSNPDTKILEIGPGHGGFQKFIKKMFTDENYYAIDVCPLFEHPRLFQTPGHTITHKVPNQLDVVYSMNVFQHLSKKQRSSYYQRIYKKLKKNGIFVFGMFVETEKNKEWPIWGTKDEDGRNYVKFFTQMTEVDREEELMNELTELGFIVEKLSQYEERSHYLTFKCTKK